MISQTITLRDIEILLDTKLGQLRLDVTQEIKEAINKASTEQAEATADLADMVSARFDNVESRLDRVERLLDASVKRIDQHDALFGYNIHIKKLKPLPTS